MAKLNTAETWKKVKFDFKFTNTFRLEVSNLGRVRSFNKQSDGNILKGSTVNGYKIIRLKLYAPRTDKDEKQVTKMKKQMAQMSQKLKALHSNKANAKELKELRSAMHKQKKELKDFFKSNAKERTINHHFLIHRLVAQYFLPKPGARHEVVAHLNHNKQDNRVTNLKWMTLAENYEHQKKSPLVIKDKILRRTRERDLTNTAKLSVNDVKKLKKLLKKPGSLAPLANRFNITETQVLRIKRGENWKNIPAAK
ncbi:MAG: hypothetical protein ABS68_10040 [Niastella sp. SCN 39-18]|nr:HNH endonuclease [Sphingobacteriales bacterium]ODT52041.1 MAG: hypothetical protein ABS68_10040 [Niastella sp. SCN 39-18]OJW11001.1 MAG: hypothetical protein BGO53_01390 [Sphingobacteriales bacterium 39-19]